MLSIHVLITLFLYECCYYWGHVSVFTSPRNNSFYVSQYYYDIYNVQRASVHLLIVNFSWWINGASTYSLSISVQKGSVCALVKSWVYNVQKKKTFWKWCWSCFFFVFNKFFKWWNIHPDSLLDRVSSFTRCKHNYSLFIFVKLSIQLSQCNCYVTISGKKKKRTKVS